MKHGINLNQRTSHKTIGLYSAKMPRFWRPQKHWMYWSISYFYYKIFEAGYLTKKRLIAFMVLEAGSRNSTAQHRLDQHLKPDGLMAGAQMKGSWTIIFLSPQRLILRGFQMLLYIYRLNRSNVSLFISWYLTTVLVIISNKAFVSGITCWII